MSARNAYEVTQILMRTVLENQMKTGADIGEKTMIVRNEIPILEYDDKSPEVIAPDHDWTAGRLPEKCLCCFSK